MITIQRETPKVPKEETDREKIVRLEGEVSDLKLVIDDMILNGGAL